MTAKKAFPLVVTMAVVLIAGVLSPGEARAATAYPIEKAVKDETFVINGEVFKAKTYCFGWEDGDMVVFLEGSAFGACATATLFNKTRKKTCEVWCE